MINNGLCWLCTLGRLGDLDISQTYIGLEHVLWKAHLAWRRRPIHAASLRQISSIEYNKEKDYVNLGLTLGRGCKRCCRPRRSASVVIFLEQTSNITEEKNTFWSRFTEFLSRLSSPICCRQREAVAVEDCVTRTRVVVDLTLVEVEAEICRSRSADQRAGSLVVAYSWPKIKPVTSTTIQNKVRRKEDILGGWDSVLSI